MTLLQVRGLTVEYHTDAGVFRAVEDLDFSLEEGRSLGLVGESGCGKTTAMMALMRLLPEAGRIVEGEALFEGADLLRLSTAQMRTYRWGKISMVFQGAMNALNPVRTVGSQIEEAICHHKVVSRGEAREEVGRLLDLVGVSPGRAGQYPHQYSGGMRQRAMIAMALSCNPNMLIADEPTTALDVTTQANILDLMLDLQRQYGMALLFITHDLGVVAEIADNVAVMYLGKIVEKSDVDTIFNNPQHPYTQALLRSIPKVATRREELDPIKGMVPNPYRRPEGCPFHPRCAKAFSECRTIVPSVTHLGENHTVQCLLYEDLSDKKAMEQSL
jgi:oligopeptide/dipeptide ABC transporter ATP-binding protein